MSKQKTLNENASQLIVPPFSFALSLFSRSAPSSNPPNNLSYHSHRAVPPGRGELLKHVLRQQVQALLFIVVFVVAIAGIAIIDDLLLPVFLFPPPPLLVALGGLGSALRRGLAAPQDVPGIRKTPRLRMCVLGRA